MSNLNTADQVLKCAEQIKRVRELRRLRVEIEAANSVASSYYCGRRSENIPIGGTVNTRLALLAEIDRDLEELVAGVTSTGVLEC